MHKTNPEMDRIKFNLLGNRYGTLKFNYKLVGQALACCSGLQPLPQYFDALDHVLNNMVSDAAKFLPEWRPGSAQPWFGLPRSRTASERAG